MKCTRVVAGRNGKCNESHKNLARRGVVLWCSFRRWFLRWSTGSAVGIRKIVTRYGGWVSVQPPPSTMGIAAGNLVIVLLVALSGFFLSLRSRSSYRYFYSVVKTDLCCRRYWQVQCNVATVIWPDRKMTYNPDGVTQRSILLCPSRILVSCRATQDEDSFFCGSTSRVFNCKHF